MNSCVKVCGKWCGYVANWRRESLRESRKLAVRVVRLCGNVFGLASWCSGSVEFVGRESGKVLQIIPQKKITIATVSTYPNTTTTNIFRKKVFNNYKKECLWN